MSQEFKQNATEQGSWSHSLEGLEPGHHVITVTDQEGNGDQMLLYVTAPVEVWKEFEQAQVIQEDNVSPLQENFSCRGMSGSYGMLIGMLAVVAFVMSVRQYYASRKYDKTHGPIFLMMVGIFVSIASVLLWMTFTLIFNGACLKHSNDFSYAVENKVGLFAGSLAAIQDFESLAGVTLQSGSQSIVTSDSGIFSFVDFSSDDSIVISHPDINDSVLFQPGVLSDVYTLYFSPDLYNAFLTVSGKNGFSDIEKYETWNASDGKQYVNVYIITSQDEKKYAFVYENGEWKLK